MNPTRITVAIDGHSSCGKSTMAKALAQAFNYIYVDTGAMYRAVTLYLMQHEIDWRDEETVKGHLPNIKIAFRRIDGQLHTMLNGEDVEGPIRSLAVSQLVSPVATISAVRRHLVALQQEMGKAKGVVMDGRDIGTVVFPKAELKIFLTAETNTRAQRRFDELAGTKRAASLEDIKNNLSERDRIDSTRADSPLRKAKDAVLIDNTNLTPSEQLAMIAVLAKERGARPL